MGGKAGRQRQAQGAELAPGLQAADALRDLAEACGKPGGQRPPGLSQLQSCARPAQQFHAQAVFQQADLVADGGGRDADFCSGTLDRKMPRRRLESPQGVERNGKAHGAAVQGLVILLHGSDPVSGSVCCPGRRIVEFVTLVVKCKSVT